MMKNACIILPARNEWANLACLVPEIFRQEQKTGSHELHVLIADSSSPDGTSGRVSALKSSMPKLHLISAGNSGIGDAYKTGMDYAIRHLDPELIFQMDADMQHDPRMIPKFVSVIRDGGFDLVIGSRFVEGGAAPGLSFFRKCLSLLGNRFILELGVLSGVRDCTSGFRCIRAERIRQCDLSALDGRGYAFQVSLLRELIGKGVRIAEIPIVLRERGFGKSKLAFRDMAGFAVFLIKNRRRFRKFSPIQNVF